MTEAQADLGAPIDALIDRLDPLQPAADPLDPLNPVEMFDPLDELAPVVDRLDPSSATSQRDPAVLLQQVDGLAAAVRAMEHKVLPGDPLWRAAELVLRRGFGLLGIDVPEVLPARAHRALLLR
jgi:hypothetical protein